MLIDNSFSVVNASTNILTL